ncbi:hypothetical protein BIW11_03902 [Tropilaelaps mercedesae]|uniref:WH2 domain-containing protein n=1 Tax=Tropilaelaps mercedesae TaxID=418985 RepID=A0A1V9XEE9_9ACAR|nr:hypothetical protein BIW11_03902 [Tropilaelaps mercedesae]
MSGSGPVGLGGLFAGGMPKLKPTGQRAVLGVASNSNGPSERSLIPSLSPPQEVSPPRNNSAVSGNAHTNLAAAIASQAAKLNEAAINNNAGKTMGGRGPIPNFSIGQSPSPDRERPLPHSEESPATFPKDVSPPQLPQHKIRPGPPLPSKPPAASPLACSLRPGQSGGMSKSSATQRPTHKPPPPPKNVNAKFGTIGHPSSKGGVRSQTQQLMRRQSLGASDANGATSVPSGGAFNVSKPQAAPPPPPPRNMSVPNNMHQLHVRQPPPVPPGPPAMSMAQKKTSSPSGVSPIPGMKPPPPPNKTTSRSTPHLAAVGIGGFSQMGVDSRFSFHNINDLSVAYEPTPNKSYPTKKAKKPHQRRAPAPPPAAAYVS